MVNNVIDYPRILSIQDISCVGQCSTAVALPVLSACGAEACILPTAVLSTHTGGFRDPFIMDLSDEMKKIVAHWKREGLSFDAILVGYLGNRSQIEFILDEIDALMNPNALLIVDPVMADHGKLYRGFDESFVHEMKKLVSRADVILPNMTEACFLSGMSHDKDDEDLDAVLAGLRALTGSDIVLTGAENDAGEIGIMMLQGNDKSSWFHEKLPGSCHGTGDLFSAAFTGAMARGAEFPRAARMAENFTLNCIRETLRNHAHSYGVKFESFLAELSSALSKEL